MTLVFFDWIGLDQFLQHIKPKTNPIFSIFKNWSVVTHIIKPEVTLNYSMRGIFFRFLKIGFDPIGLDWIGLDQPVPSVWIESCPPLFSSLCEFTMFEAFFKKKILSPNQIDFKVFIGTSLKSMSTPKQNF